MWWAELVRISPLFQSCRPIRIIGYSFSSVVLYISLLLYSKFRLPLLQLPDLHWCSKLANSLHSIEWFPKCNRILSVELLSYSFCIQSEAIFNYCFSFSPRKADAGCMFTFNSLADMLTQYVSHSLLYQTDSRHFVALRKILRWKNCIEKEKITHIPPIPCHHDLRKTLHTF